MISYVFGEGVTCFFHIAKKRNNHVVSIAAHRVLLTGHPTHTRYVELNSGKGYIEPIDSR